MSKEEEIIDQWLVAAHACLRRLHVIKNNTPQHITDEMYRPVLEYFSGNYEKTNRWFVTENPMLGDVRPCEMILDGKGDKLQKWIDDAII